MSPMIRLTVDDEARFPRVSGDEPPGQRADLLHDGFSPRERG